LANEEILMSDELVGQHKNFFDGYNEGYKDGYAQAKKNLFELVDRLMNEHESSDVTPQ
jgi:hypothetical protein